MQWHGVIIKKNEISHSCQFYEKFRKFICHIFKDIGTQPSIKYYDFGKDGWNGPSRGRMPSAARGNLLNRKCILFIVMLQGSAATALSPPDLLEVLPAYKCRK